MRYFSILFLCSFFVFHTRAMQQVGSLRELAAKQLTWQNQTVQNAYKDDYRLGYDYCMSQWKKSWLMLAQPIVLNSPHHRHVLDSVFMRNENRVITVGVDGKICLWNLAERQLELIVQGHAMKIDAVAIRSDQRYLATASEDGTAILWEIESQVNENGKKSFSLKKVRTFQHGEPVTSVALNFHQTTDGEPCGLEIITGSQSGRVRIFNGETGEGACLNDKARLQSWVRSLSLSSDNSCITAGANGSVVTFDRSNRVVNLVTQEDTSCATSMAVTSDGAVWGTLLGEVCMQLPRYKPFKQTMSPSGINYVAWSSDKQMMVAGNVRSKGCLPQIYIATLSPNEDCAPLTTFNGASLFISTIVVNPDKGDILIGDGNGQLLIYSIRRAAERMTLIQARFVLDILPGLIKRDLRDRDNRYIVCLGNTPWAAVYNGLDEYIKGIVEKRFSITA